MQRKSGGVVGLLGVLKLNKKQFMEARTVFSTHICVVVMQRVKSGSRVKLRYKVCGRNPAFGGFAADYFRLRNLVPRVSPPHVAPWDVKRRDPGNEVTGCIRE